MKFEFQELAKIDECSIYEVIRAFLELVGE